MKDADSTRSTGRRELVHRDRIVKKPNRKREYAYLLGTAMAVYGILLIDNTLAEIFLIVCLVATVALSARELVRVDVHRKGVTHDTAEDD